MDNNQRIGIALIFVVFIGYYFFFAPKDMPAANAGADSTAVAAATTTGPRAADSLSQAAQLPAIQAEQTVVLKNKELELTLSTAGGRVKSARLIDFQTYDGKPMYLVDAQKSKFFLKLPGQAQMANWQIANQTANAVTFVTNAGGGTIEQRYELPADGFVVNYAIKSNGQLNGQVLQMHMRDDVRHTEKDLAQNRNNSTVNYYTAEGDFDNLGERNLDQQDKNLNEGLRWVSLKTQFFNAGFIAENGLTGASLSSGTLATNDKHVKNLQAVANIPGQQVTDGKANFRFYFGPNRFHLLKEITEGYERNVYLGYPVINWINRYVTTNVFRFLESFISNYGVIILILVILLRVVLFPLAYKSYISMAKMKVLKPEIDAIKAKHGDDMAAVQAEQMTLYQQVGINPISGCIPMLLQLPILLAMFNFFPNSVELRQQSFLWAEDLSTYDSIATLPFSLPGYGSHVSLFTILMTASTLLLTWYNNQTSTVTGPMQSVSYIMPVMFMFFLNSFPAGLNFYYLSSNLVSFAQQVLIRQSVDDKKIREKLDSNRVKNAGKKPGGFQARLAEAMKMAEEAKKQQQQSKKK